MPASSSSSAHRDPQRLVRQRVDRRRPAARSVSASTATSTVPACDQRDDLGRRALPQPDLDPRVLAVEVRERLGQPRRVGRGRGDPHHAARDARCGGPCPPGPRATSASTASAWTSRSAPAAVSSTPCDVRRSSVEPELGLQPPDLLRERRLGDVERLGRAREVPVARDRREVLELAQLHVLDTRRSATERPASSMNSPGSVCQPAVPVLEGARGERDVDDDLLARGGLDDREAHEPARRALDRAVRARRVDLDDLAAAPRARCCTAAPCEPSIAEVLPARVAEPVAERQQRLDVGPR